MGEVYRARDTRLGRDVALKILPAEVSGDRVRLERFDREARAIAALNHPHIVTIYSTEEAAGVRFFTMELVDGLTLTDAIVSGGIEIGRFLQIAVPLADALTAAHAKQITHRDLKPGNVMVTHDGRVKVLDFGLARVGGVEPGEQSMVATRAPVTQAGMVVGTMPYMSPEQVEGQPLDPRSDLFSLGVIFYELLTGDRPFQGASSPALMSAILREVPASVNSVRTDAPESLARLVARLLEKRPEDRVQTARDVYNELRHLQKQYESGASPQMRSSAFAPLTHESVSVCVMPFIARGSDDDSTALAEGLTDDITTGLSRFGNLRVSSHAAAEQATAPAARHHGARYVLDGTVRRAARSIRVSVRVVDTKTGAHVWADNFDRDASTDAFSLQDDIASRVVATVGDPTGVLTTTMAASLADKPLDRMSVAELIVRFYAYTKQLRPDEHGPLRAAFERALQREPRAGEGWACLAVLYSHEHTLDLNPLPDSLARHQRAAERAVELDSQSQHAWIALVRAHLFAHDPHALRGTIDRAVSLNPLNADGVAMCALFLSGSGEFDRAVELAARAMALKPTYSGWFHFPAFNAHYARNEYEDALRVAKLINMPLLPLAQYTCAAAAGQLGRAAELLDPQSARRAITVWFWDAAFIESLLEGVHKALALVEQRTSPAQSRNPASDIAASAFVITVLPFQAPTTGDASILADGITQGVAVGLSRFHYLRVVTRNVSRDTVTSGYVLHGSVRESAGTVRVVAQLIDAQSDATVWAESFDRSSASVSSAFALQDELIAMIVGTIADANGALVRSIASVVRAKPVEALTPYEAVLRRYAYMSTQSPSEHAVVRDALERAVQQAPSYAEAWAVLAQVYIDEFSQEFNPRPHSLVRARAAAFKALEINQSSQGAHLALAMISYFTRDIGAFRASADRTIAINPLDTSALAMLGTLTAYAGEWEAGMAICARARALNTQHPGIYWMSTIIDRYRRRDYAGALEILNRVNMPGYPQSYLMRATIYAQLGRIDEGRALLREAEAKLPGISSVESGTRRAWLGDALEAHVREGLDKLA
jgi:TolB-like protein/Tfp pilus assembly protein PilF